MADFDYISFLEVAEEILTGTTGGLQPQLRTAVGRVYYAAHGHLRKRLVTTCGDRFGSSGKHTALCEACVRSSNPHILRIGQRLKMLLSARVRADYKWNSSQGITEPEAMTALDTAKAVVEKITHLQTNDLQEINTRL